MNLAGFFRAWRARRRVIKANRATLLKLARYPNATVKLTERQMQDIETMKLRRRG